MVGEEAAIASPQASSVDEKEDGGARVSRPTTKAEKVRSCRSTGELRAASRRSERGKEDHVHMSGKEMVGTLKTIAQALTGMQVAMETMKSTMEKTDVTVRNVRSQLKAQGQTVSRLKKRVHLLESAGPYPVWRGPPPKFGTRSLSSTTIGRSSSSSRGTLRHEPWRVAATETTPPPMPPYCEERLASLGLNLLKAAQNGRVKDVLKLLNAGADPNYTYGSKWTPLHRAVAQSHASVVSILLENSANVNASTCYGLSPLHIASCHDYIGRCVKMLLEARADFSCRDRHGWTPLHYAAESGNLVAVRALRAVGASQNAKDNKGKTPFDVTRTSCIKKLIRSCSRGEWARSYVCRFKRNKQQNPKPSAGTQQT